jgi:hypothetical protein
MQFNQAMVVSAVAGAGAYAAYKFNVLPKKVAAYGAMGIIGLSLVAVASDSLADDIPWVLGGAGIVALAYFLL